MQILINGLTDANIKDIKRMVKEGKAGLLTKNGYYTVESGGIEGNKHFCTIKITRVGETFEANIEYTK